MDRGLPAEWTVAQLGDLADWYSGGTPKTSEPSYWNGDIPWISSGSLKTFQLRDSQRRITKLGLVNGSRLVPENSIIFVVRGMSLKTEFRVGIARRPVAFGQDCKALVAHPNVVPLFLAQAIRARADNVLSMVDEAGHGTGRLATDRIKSLRIALPPVSEQRAIAEVLGALDDKLEANYWLARRSYEFAVAAGVQAVDSAVGPWQSIEEVATISKGVSYRSEDLVEGLGWLVSLKCAGRDGSFNPAGLKPFSGDVKPAHIVDEGDILVSQTDLTQRAEVIGRPFRVQRSGVLGRLVGSLDFSIIRPKPPLSREVLLALLSTADFRSHVLGYCNGTTVLHMNSRAVPSFQFRMPDAQEVTRVSGLMDSLLKQSDSIQAESRALEKLRDTLLPQLVCGELRVHDTELLVKDSA